MLPSSDSPPTRRETWRALLLLLPAALFVTPILRGVPSAGSMAAGLALLAALPIAGWTLLAPRKHRLAPILLLLVPLGVALYHTFLGEHADSFSASRSTLSLATALVLMCAAAHLPQASHVVLLRALAGASLAWTLGALIDTLIAAERSWSGMLENTGDLSEAALPGALCALYLTRDAATRWRVLGWSSLGAYAIYVTWVPVHAGSISLLAALLIATLAGARDKRSLKTSAIALAIVLAAGLAHMLAARPEAMDTAPAVDTASSTAAADDTTAPVEYSSDLGGRDFRLLTWQRLPALLRDNLWLGVGPGQFERAYPPYRAAEEIRLSSYDYSAPFETQVEHAHNDWFQLLLDGGLVGGLPWIFFLLAVALNCLRCLRTGSTSSGLAAATIAMLVNSCFSSPLLAGPASAPIAFALIGTQLAALQPGRLRWRAQLLPALALALALAQARRALDFVQHGLALAPLSSRYAVVRESGELGPITGHDREDKRRSLALALAACPDSCLALSEQAHFLRVTSADEARELDVWRRVLELQPHRFEALLAVGNLHARAARLAAAELSFEAAWRLDPHHPGLQRNRLLLALAEGDPATVARAISEVEGALDSPWLERSGAEQLLKGRPHLAFPLLAEIDNSLLVTDGALALELSGNLRGQQRELLADGMQTLAHQLWGRQHVESEAFSTAVRSYRQSVRVAREYAEDLRGPRALRLELAAALTLAGETDEARELLTGLVPSPLELIVLPTWAGEALFAAGLLQGR